MHTLVCKWKSSWGDPSHQEEEDSEDSDNPGAETWYYKRKQVAGKPLPKTMKLGCNPLHTERVLQLIRKVKKIQKRRGDITSLRAAVHLGKDYDMNLRMCCSSPRKIRQRGTRSLNLHEEARSRSDCTGLLIGSRALLWSVCWRCIPDAGLFDAATSPNDAAE